MNPGAEWIENPSLAEEIKTLFNQKDDPNAEQKLRSLLAQLDLLQQNLKQTPHLLGKRTKELSHLYRLSDLVTRENISEKDFLQELVNLIPSAWQYPEIACARIVFDKEEFKTENFRKTDWIQSSEIKIKNKPAGHIEVCYFENKPEEYEGPFLKEERILIDSIAIKTGHYFERKIMRDELGKNEENLRITLNSIGDAVIATDIVGRVTNLNPVAEKLTGWKYGDALNKPVEEIFVIKNARTGEQVQNPVQKVLETGGVVGLANHTKLVSKNGKEYQIADSGAPIKNDDGKVIGVVLVFRDVTEEYKIQQELKDNELKFRSIVEGAPDPIFIQSDMKFAYLNPSACRLFGIESAEELVGTPVMDRFHPDYHEKIRQRIKALNQDAQSVRELLKQKFIRTDGSEVWVETTGEPIIFNGKNSALVFVRDISQRVKDEEAIHEHQRQLASMIGNLPGFVYRCKYDENWTMLYLSPQFEKITGYLAADFIHNKKRTFNDSIIKEFQPEIFKQWEKAIAEKSFFEAEYPIQSNDNQIKWIWERGTGVFDDRGNVLFLEGYIEDITQRKQNEAILRESEERFSIAFKASPAPLVISEIETGLFIDVNNRWVEMLGFSREEQIGKTSKEVGIWRNPPERDRIIQKVLKKGFFKDEYIEFKTKTGETILALWSAETIMHSGKKLMLSMIHDITARVKAENELLRLKENLEVEVEEKTRELRERIAELERFQQATIDREFRIKELRDEIQLLKNKTIDTNHDTS
jgi:PAS domain S-box-containing protein